MALRVKSGALGLGQGGDQVLTQTFGPGGQGKAKQAKRNRDKLAQHGMLGLGEDGRQGGTRPGQGQEESPAPIGRIFCKPTVDSRAACA